MFTKEEYVSRFQAQASYSDVERIASNLDTMRKGPVAQVWKTVLKLWALIRDPKAAWASKALAIAALIYLITPVDAIPDFIPVLGLTDDVAVILAAAAKLASDLHEY